jgi:hypothetical protein
MLLLAPEYFVLSERCLGEKFTTCTPRKNINRIIKSLGRVSRLRMKRNVYMELMEKREGKKAR